MPVTLTKKCLFEIDELGAKGNKKLKFSSHLRKLLFQRLFANTSLKLCVDLFLCVTICNVMRGNFWAVATERQVNMFLEKFKNIGCVKF